MKKNTKGLSTIVATLIIILLVLVAVGIIWVVVRNVVQGGSDSIEISAKCIDSQVSATRVVSGTAVNTYNVSLSRTSGTDEIAGVKLVFSDVNGTTNFVVDVPGNIVSLGSIMQVVTILPTDLANPSKVGVVVYFEDDSGEEQLCQIVSPFEF